MAEPTVQTLIASVRTFLTLIAKELDAIELLLAEAPPEGEPEPEPSEPTPLPGSDWSLVKDGKPSDEIELLDANGRDHSAYGGLGNHDKTLVEVRNGKLVLIGRRPDTDPHHARVGGFRLKQTPSTGHIRLHYTLPSAAAFRTLVKMGEQGQTGLGLASVGTHVLEVEWTPRHVRYSLDGTELINQPVPPFTPRFQMELATVNVSDAPALTLLEIADFQLETLGQPPESPDPIPVPLPPSGLLREPLWSTRVAVLASQTSDAAIAARLREIADYPTALWIGDWPGSLEALEEQVRRSRNGEGRLVFTSYNVPFRDMGSWSTGGAPDWARYFIWWERVLNIVGDLPCSAIIEPDAISQALSDDAPWGLRDDRIENLRDLLKAIPENVTTYLDAGHATWPFADRLIPALHDIRPRRIALNVSNYWTHDAVHARFLELRAALGLEGYVVDVSRNGAGVPADARWCNAPWAQLGKAPTLESQFDFCDGELWIKHPGESDGECEGGPKAGEWWPEGLKRLAA